MAFEVTRQEILKQAIALNKLWKQTRDQKYREEELRLRRISVELENVTVGGGGVTSIVAGTNVTISPVDGTGDVTINASGGGGISRTVDSYSATEGQTNFSITASSFDFVDVYVNGARLISSEYTIASNVVTITSALELDDEVVLISYVEGSGGGGGGGVLYSSTLVAYNTQNLASGSTMNLTTDGTGVTGLIIPTATNATWNVTVDTIATVISITGTATDVFVGDTYSETTKLVFKKIGSTSTLVAIVSSDAGFDTSMTTATMNYSVGGSQNLNLQFEFPTFVGDGSVEINAISKLEIVEATY